MTSRLVTMALGFICMCISIALVGHAQTLLQVGLSLAATLLSYIVFAWEVILFPYSNE